MGQIVYHEDIDHLRATRPELEPLIESPAGTYLKLAINTTKLRKRAYTTLDELFRSKEPRLELNSNAPFSIASKVDASKLICYPNIPRHVDPDKLADHAQLLWSDGRRRKSIEEHERAETYSMRREVTTLGKFLMKYSNLKTLGYKDDQVRSLCEKLSIEAGPPQVITCEHVEDYVPMFRVKTGSCMELGSSYWQDWSRVSLKKIAEDTGIFFGCWYHYAPWCKGAYVSIGGTPVARFMLYREDLTKDEWPFYGDVRGASRNYQKVFDDWLEARGVRPYRKMAATICDFTIPGMTHPLLEDRYGGGQLFCPLGNMDNQHKDFSVCYDADTKEFRFGPSGKHRGTLAITDTYKWYGFIPSSKVPQYKT